MGRKLLIAVALAALVVTAAAAASPGGGHTVVSSTTTELMPGVTYTRESDLTANGPVVLDIVTAPQADGTVYSLAPVLSNGALGGSERLTTMEKGLDDAGATTVGIDGDYFNSRGEPNSILVQGGVLENEPNVGRTSLGIATDGTISAAEVASYGTWQATAGQQKLLLNSNDAHFSLYTPAYGSATPPETGPVAEAVFSSFPPLQAGQDLGATVSQIASAGATPIPPGGAVLVARGSDSATQLQDGQQITVHFTLTPDWSGLASAIGGGPLLVQNGKAVFANGETFQPGSLQGRTARGAIGQLADGRIVLVTAEATTLSYSVGISSYDLARELVKLGAVTAVGLGAGAPAGMAFDGKLLTRPSSGHERGIADALVLSYTGVYAAPVAPVLSPNGDGVADTESLSYYLPRPATVTATLNGPNGATVQLPGGPQSKGVHTSAWDGASEPEGAWTFSVSATDDRSVTTKAERTFSLDDTLGSLTVGRASRGEFARFILSRHAGVVVRVERTNGAVVRAFHFTSLAAGPHEITWTGLIDGKRAPKGGYQMRVDATSTIGTSELVAPFALK